MNNKNENTHKIAAEKTFWYICLSFYFLSVGFSLLLKTNSGNTLIHEIRIESEDGRTFGAVLYRPVSASATDPYPSALLVYMDGLDSGSGDYAAMELTKAGFVVLSISGAENKDLESAAKAGYTFLATRSFTDHEKISLAVWDRNPDSPKTDLRQPFISSVFITPSRDRRTEVRQKDGIHIISCATNNDMIAGVQTLTRLSGIIAAASGVSAAQLTGILPQLLFALRLFRIVLIIALMFLALFFATEKFSSGSEGNIV
ncbi:MAG: hypothetical protein IJI14_20000 [Anaerolineaceae bacterium]|nr:hypothetical protein [Anaerolineaceae bacterium]